MTRYEKFDWMAVWAAKHGARLTVEGECGFGRECVGILVHESYPDYEWYDADYERVDANGEVWRPPHAYHKHPCVAVLGRGEQAEAELYDWLRWFDDNGFEIETGRQEMDPQLPPMLGVLMGKDRYARMVKRADGQAQQARRCP